MKKILLSLIVLLSANFLSLTDNYVSKEQSLSAVSEKRNVNQIAPRGAWFTEDEETL